MKKGFILTLILIIILISLAFFLYSFFSVYPDEKTQKITNTIVKYPYAKTWEINNNKKLCLYYFNGCEGTPSQIILTSKDSWNEVYEYFKTTLAEKGWETNSEPFTSIPTGIILTNKTYYKNTDCEAFIEKKSKDTGSDNLNTYIITVSCINLSTILNDLRTIWAQNVVNRNDLDFIVGEVEKYQFIFN